LDPAPRQSANRSAEGYEVEEVEAPVFDRSRRGAVALMVSVNIREHSPPAIRDSVARKGHTKTARHHQLHQLPLDGSLQ
jgi:hypothetical protein